MVTFIVTKKLKSMARPKLADELRASVQQKLY